MGVMARYEGSGTFLKGQRFEHGADYCFKKALFTYSN
jgi:hypothetical protein